MTTHDWSQFRLRIPVKADTDAIYRAWTTQEGLENWFLRKAAFTKKDGTSKERKDTVEPGDTYEWLWHGWGDEIVERGVIKEVNHQSSFGFSFGKAGNVNVAIKKEEGDILLELVQSDIPTDETSKAYFYLGCQKGWLFYLTNLKSILEGGIDLRNRKVELKDVVNS